MKRAMPRAGPGNLSSAGTTIVIRESAFIMYADDRHFFWTLEDPSMLPSSNPLSPTVSILQVPPISLLRANPHLSSSGQWMWVICVSLWVGLVLLWSPVKWRMTVCIYSLASEYPLLLPAYSDMLLVFLLYLSSLCKFIHFRCQSL